LQKLEIMNITAFSLFGSEEGLWTPWPTNNLRSNFWNTWTLLKSTIAELVSKHVTHHDPG
jgi:hypothetical protein